ncbi:MAG: dienelactone hydrolase family protein [Pseudomonadota bacterium]
MRSAVVSFLFGLAVLLSAVPARAESSIISFPVTGADGSTVTLDAKLNIPDGDGPFPAVVMLHGCNGTDLSWEWEEGFLEQWGYVSLRIDSLGPRGIETVCGSADAAVTSDVRVMDALAGHAFLSTQHFVDAAHIGVVGWSDGGTTALKSIAGDLIDQVAPSDTFEVAVAFYPRCQSHAPELDAPLLILVGSEDTATAPVLCEAMKQEIRADHGFDLIVFPGATHAFDWEGAPSTYQGHQIRYDPDVTAIAYMRMRAFLSQHLQ